MLLSSYFLIYRIMFGLHKWWSIKIGNTSNQITKCSLSKLLLLIIETLLFQFKHRIKSFVKLKSFLIQILCVGIYVCTFILKIIIQWCEVTMVISEDRGLLEVTFTHPRGSWFINNFKFKRNFGIDFLNTKVWNWVGIVMSTMQSIPRKNNGSLCSSCIPNLWNQKMFIKSDCTTFILKEHTVMELLTAWRECSVTSLILSRPDTRVVKWDICWTSPEFRKSRREKFPSTSV